MGFNSAFKGLIWKEHSALILGTRIYKLAQLFKKQNIPKVLNFQLSFFQSGDTKAVHTAVLNKTDNARITLTQRRVRVTMFAVGENKY